MSYISQVVVVGITLYQKTISPDHGMFRGAVGPVCRYSPTCSEYAKQAILQHGLRGILMAIMRVGRCHPFAEGGYDPVSK